MAMAGDGGNRSLLSVFCHELTHRFIAFHFPTAPIWVNEGLASYFETLRIEGCALRSLRDSSCWTCHWAVGDIQLHRNQVERAAHSLRTAVNLAGENAPPSLREQLEAVLARGECQTTPSGC